MLPRVVLGQHAGRASTRPTDQPVSAPEDPFPRPPGSPPPRRGRPARLHARTVRRWPRRVLVATNVVVAVMLLAAGSVYGYVNWRFGQIKKISVPSIAAAKKGKPPNRPAAP